MGEEKFLWSSDIRIAWRRWEDSKCQHESTPITSCIDCLEDSHKKAITRAIKGERERCAKIAEDYPLTWKQKHIQDLDYHGNHIASAIRRPPEKGKEKPE